MEIKAYGLNHHPDISSFFDDYGVDNSDDLFDAFDNQAVDIDGVKAVCYYVEDDPDNIEMHILCDYWDHDTIKHTIANFLNSDLCESKKSDQDESKGANEAAGEPSDVKDIAAYIKSLDPQTAPMYDAFGNKTGTVSFPKWYSDTKKLLFPCKFYSDEDMNKIIKQGDEFISKKFGEGAYELTLEKVFSNAFHSNCYAVRIKPAVKEASGKAESKKSEAISPKLQLRKKFQAFDNLAKKLAFFRVSGKSAKDWYEGDYDSIGDFYDEESDAKEAAEKVFDDFDEYVDYRVDYDGSASELNYCPVFKFKPEFWELSVNDMSEVLAMLDDALQEYV